MKFFAKLAIAATVAPAFVVVSATSASAVDCASLVGTYVSGSSRYAKIRNDCGHGISAKAVVNYFPDSACIGIGAYLTQSVRTGGVASPDADSAREC